MMKHNLQMQAELSQEGLSQPEMYLPLAHVTMWGNESAKPVDNCNRHK